MTNTTALDIKTLEKQTACYFCSLATPSTHCDWLNVIFVDSIFVFFFFFPFPFSSVFFSTGESKCRQQRYHHHLQRGKLIPHGVFCASGCNCRWHSHRHSGCSHHAGRDLRIYRFKRSCNQRRGLHYTWARVTMERNPRPPNTDGIPLLHHDWRKKKKHPLEASRHLHFFLC